ncbi:hypothetical protein BDP27DRAFT_152257 [Rhodocollybia butyracea]|uniref:MYND-type domain-containing protein n=1 Tax=Rhodocollybia butyracea TaxID=206335 RepID=A0A9P5Q3F9_9AGAR|nr:hypothetical protein BDP27DRAFT_152257 [Rhodocollybia butyracea]
MDLTAKQQQNLSLSNTCDCCDRHLRAIHAETVSICARCLPADTNLRTCSACTLRRYCSAECQRNDWPKHRQMCLSSRQQGELRKLHGPHIEARHEAFERFSKKYRLGISFPAAWGMGIGTDSDVSQTHILLIYLDVEDHIGSNINPKFRYLLREARITTESDVRSLFQSRFQEPIQFELAQVNCVRIWLVDDGLPSGLDVTNFVVECVDMDAMRSQVYPTAQCDWLELIRSYFAGGKEPLAIEELVYYTAADDQRVAGNKQWLQKNGENIVMAGIVAMDLPKNRKHLATHCFVIHINVEQKMTDTGNFRFRRSVKHARIQTLEKVKDLFYYDLPNFIGRGQMVRSLLVEPPPNSIRCIIVDDGVPFPNSIQGMAMESIHFTDYYLKLAKRNFPPREWITSLKRLLDDKAFK